MRIFFTGAEAGKSEIPYTVADASVSFDFDRV
jgi:hypothetical protein